MKKLFKSFLVLYSDMSILQSAVLCEYTWGCFNWARLDPETQSPCSSTVLSMS